MIRINNKMLREIKKLYLEGYSTKKVAKELDVSISAAWSNSKKNIVEIN